MNILVVSAIYPEPDEYNIRKDTNVVHYFAREWVKNGHNVIVLHLYQNPIKYIFKLGINRKISETDLDGVKVIYSFSQIFIPRKNSTYKIQQKLMTKRIEKYMKQNYFDFVPDVSIVHFPMSFFEFCKNYLSNFNNKVATLHGIDVRIIEDMKNSKKTVSDMNSLFSKICYRSCILKKRGEMLGLNSRGDSIVYSGISPQLIASEIDIMKKMESSNEVLSIVYAGQLIERKNVDTIIRAVSCCKSRVELTIIGDGPMKNSLIELSRQLNVADYTCFCGKLSREKVVEKMRDADVFVMVSVNETLGLVYLEAMAQGCIVIGTKSEGIDGIIEDGLNGFLVDPYDVKGLANRFDCIAHSSKRLNSEIMFNAYNTTAQMTSEQLANKYLDIATDL